MASVERLDLTGALRSTATVAADGVERVHRRALEPLEELPGVGAEALDEAPLPLGVEGIHGERGLARPARPGQRDELAGRKVEVDAAEVVGAGATEADGEHAGRDHI